MLLKFKFNFLISSSASIFGTFAFSSPLLMFSDALIRLIMGLVSLLAKDMATAVDITQHNTHVLSLEGSRDRVGAKLLLEKLAKELGIELDLPWNFVPEKIALIGEE